MTRSVGSLSRSTSRQTESQHSQGVTTRARRAVLQRSPSSGLNTESRAAEVAESLQCPKVVQVEARPHNLKSSIFYAPESKSQESTLPPFTDTEFVTINPEFHEEDVVYQDDSFEIHVLGMSVSPQDGFSFNNNELLLYSLKADFEPDDGSAESTPYIHFDPNDAPDSGSEPDQFIPVKSSKSLFLAYDGEQEGNSSALKKQVFCRFSIMEIDDISSLQSSIDGIKQLGDHLQTHSSVVPQLGTLGPALSVASALGKRVLNAYARPDRVLSPDFRFLLAERRSQGVDPIDVPPERKKIVTSGDFLRYGYYFFLSRAVDVKLFATTNISSNNVTLMLKRADELPPDETRYFPLTGVSYLAIRVSRGVKSGRAGIQRNPVNTTHAQRMEQLLGRSFGLGGSEGTGDDLDDESANAILTDLKTLAEELGLQSA